MSDNEDIARRLLGFVEAAQQVRSDYNSETQPRLPTLAEIVEECVAALDDDERDALDFAMARMRRFLASRFA
jgi:hypothetical protein